RFGTGRAVDPVAELYDITLGLRQVLDGAPQGLLTEVDLDLLLGRGGAALEQLAERRLPILADRAVEACDGARRLAHLVDLRDGQVRLASDLLVGWVAAELGAQLTLDPSDLPLALPDVDRDADGPRAVGHAALYRLPDPESGVGGELVTLSPVELL